MTEQEKSRASMEGVKYEIKQNRYKDVLEAMKTVAEDHRGDFFKVFFWELNNRLNTGDRKYVDEVNKFNSVYQKHK